MRVKKVFSWKEIFSLQNYREEIKREGFEPDQKLLLLNKFLGTEQLVTLHFNHIHARNII